MGIGDAVASLAWSPDGRRLAVGCASGKIALYDVGRGVVVTPANGTAGASAAWTGAARPRERLAGSGRACRERVSVLRAVAAMRSRRVLADATRRAACRRARRWRAGKPTAKGLRPALVAGRRRAGDGRRPVHPSYFLALLTPSTRRLLDGVAVCVLAEERRGTRLTD